MKKISIIITAIVAAIILIAVLFVILTPKTPETSNDGKLVLNDTMIMVLEDGFELDGKYDARLCPNGQLALSRANRTILEVEEKKDVQIDHEFCDYEMLSYSKVDDYNYVAKMKLKLRDGAGEYSYFETDVYFFCVEADTVGGFDLQAYCVGLEDYIEDLI